jgi:hypothetical protein
MPVAASVSWCVLMAATRASKISFAVDVLVCWLGCVSDDVIGFTDESYSCAAYGYENGYDYLCWCHWCIYLR